MKRKKKIIYICKECNGKVHSWYITCPKCGYCITEKPSSHKKITKKEKTSHE